jgi:hypothetical protein
VDPVPDPLLLRKSGSAGNRTRDPWVCSQKPRPQRRSNKGKPLSFLLNSCLSGLFIVSDDGDSMSLKNVSEVLSTRRHIPEDNILDNRRCERF